MGIRKKNSTNTQQRMKTMIKKKDMDKEEVNEVKDNGEDKDEGPLKQGQKRWVKDREDSRKGIKERRQVLST